MDTLSTPSRSPRSPTRMPRRWARKCERYCCVAATYFPLAFVYSITTWAVWVEATIGFLADGSRTRWIGKGTSFLGILLYLLLNWSYSTAVFTSPGTTTSGNSGYSALPTHNPVATSFTVKANGELRYCKKCQARKPDRSHHCSTCGTCVLKMDHHCPWLSTCVGLRNHKAFLLFLIYTTLFCFLCFGVSGTWVWREILSDGEHTDSLLPVNYVMLVVISGIIGLVLGGFTGWHILLASRGQTTIECLEKTRYLSPLRKSMRPQYIPENRRPDYQGQYRDIHANGEIQPIAMNHGQQRQQSYEEVERARARERYEEYLDEQDSEKLPSAFDLGWKRNLRHLFGPKPLLWPIPICNTIGDGWSWEPSPKWLEARERLAEEREAQRRRESAAGWGADLPAQIMPQQQSEGAGRHYVSPTPSRVNRSQSKADRILGRNPSQYVDMDGADRNSVSMQTFSRRTSDEDDYELSSDEDEAERRILDRKATHGWPQKVGVVTNTLRGNTISRQKDDVRGWDGHDDVD
ncbi:palmitoyltransferase for Vac8p [Clarireedia jacksonii]